MNTDPRPIAIYHEHPDWFRPLFAELDRRRAYEPGRFVAIAGGRIVADADSFGGLRTRLAALGKDSPEVFVVQAGVEYAETAVIFATDSA